MSASPNWLQHALRRTPWRTQRQALALAALAFFVAIIIGALYLAQAAAVATLGRQLEEQIAVRNRLEQTNEQLRMEIARLQSMARLFERARELGFVLAERDDIEYLVIPGYDPAARAANVPLPAPPPTAVPVYDESFLGWLQQQWDAFTRQQAAPVNPEEAS
ncbi:MAG: hypothetical protein ACUVSX_00045 [Aggregatilineales bacterium]